MESSDDGTISSDEDCGSENITNEGGILSAVHVFEHFIQIGVLYKSGSMTISIVLIFTFIISASAQKMSQLPGQLLSLESSKCIDIP